MEKDPHQFLEGILIACFATKATTAYIYLRFEYIQAYRILEAAIAEARAAGHLGKNIYGSGFNLDIWVHRGAGAYICGEETGLIESLEGKRGWPRIKPPFPAIEGAFRKPTVVNNVETLCCVPAHHRAGRDLVQVDRHAQELRAQALLRLGPREQAGLRRAAPGRHLPRADRRARRRRLEGAEGQGRRARRDQHGAALGRRAGHAARLREPAQARLPGPGHGRRHRDRRPDQHRRLPVQHLPLLRPRELRPVHALPRRAPAGCTRR